MGIHQSSREPILKRSAVLRLLAVGMSPPAVVARVSERDEPEFSIAEFLETLAHAATLAREQSLLPPAEAAFFGRTLLPPAGPFGDAAGVELSAADLDSLRALAVDVIEAYLTEERDTAEAPDPKHDAMHSAALQYAEALLRQEEIIDKLNRASRNESSLHSRLSDSDRKRVHDLVLNRGGTLLDSLVNGWQRFAEHLHVRPESFAYEDYEQGLSRRDMVEDAVSLITPRSRTIVEALVDPSDEQFLDATREASTSIRPRSPWEPQRWWWYRVPIRLGEHFNDRLAHLSRT